MISRANDLHLLINLTIIATEVEMQTATIYETKTKLSSLIKLIEQSNERILITKHGHPVAELGPVSRKSRLLVDPFLAGIHINYDPVEPTEDEWPPE